MATDDRAARSSSLARAKEWWHAWRALPLAECRDAESDLMLATLIEDVRHETRAEVIAWLRDEKAMGEYDGLAECTYDTAVFPEDLANALEKAWPSSSKGPGEST